MYATGKNDEFIATPAASASPEGISIAYSPLLTAMRGRKWVFKPHCVETSYPNIKINLLEVPGGYVLPVTFGGTAESATAQVRTSHEIFRPAFFASPVRTDAFGIFTRPIIKNHAPCETT